MRTPGNAARDSGSRLASTSATATSFNQALLANAWMSLRAIPPPPMLAWRKTGRWADTARRGSAIDAAPSPASVMNR